MKKIKFRAWDNVNEEMVYEGKGWGELRNYDILQRYENVMQFIGLKDKNGVEIYEGDIVRITHPFKNSNWVGEIFWDNFMWNGKGFHFNHLDSPNDLLCEGLEYIEVIGNIHENKELLK